MSDQICVGTDVATGSPVFLPLNALKQHLAVRGNTGALKTVWVTLIVCAIMLLRSACVVVADLGGDQFMFHQLRKLSSELGRTFRFLSLRHDEDWDFFDPLHSCVPLCDENLVQVTNFLTSALSLSHGEGFATGYYGDVSTLTLQDTLQHCIESGITHPTLNQIAELSRKFSRQFRREVAQTEMVLRQLAPYPQLRRSNEPAREIRMDRAIEDGEIIYGYFPGVLDPNVPKLAGLLTYTAIMSAIKRAEAGLPRRETYIVLEEASLIVRSPSFQKALVLARKYDIRLVLLYQSTAQLQSGPYGTDMRPVISDNCATKLYLSSFGKEDVEDLRSYSQDVERLRDGGKSFQGLRMSTQIRGVFEPALERNEILEASAITGEGYLVLRLGDQHREPVRIRFAPAVLQDRFTPEYHADLSRRPLPKRKPATSDAAVPTATPSTDCQKVTSERAERRAKLLALLQACVQAESWQD